MEDTTTVQPTDQGVEASTQPTNVEQNTAEAPQNQQQTDAPSTQPQTGNDDTADWLAKKGYNMDDPELVAKLAKSYRESEKLALTSAQRAAALEKSLTPTQPQQFDQGQNGGDPLVSEFIQDYKREKQIKAFEQSHEDWAEYEKPMVGLLNETLSSGYTRSELVNAGLLSLDDVYAMAKGSAPVDTTAIENKARTETLQTLANTQRAGGANAHASDSSPKSEAVTRSNVESWYSNLSPAERARPENQQRLSSLLNS